MRRHYLFLLLIMLSLLVSFTFLIASPAHAATFTVNHDGDASDETEGDGDCMTPDGFCTLRAAIEEANALPGDDFINVFGVGSIDTNSQLTITSNITIDGQGVVVDNTGTGRVFNITTGTVVISRMTITGGDGVVNGGGIYIDGASLTLRGAAQVTGNDAVGGGGGSGIYATNGAQVTVAGGANVSENGSTSYGMGIYADFGADVFINNAGAVSNHTGATNAVVVGSGVYVTGFGTTLTVNGGTINNNRGATTGGGVYATSRAVVKVQNGGIIVGNDAANAGSGIYATSEAQVIITGAGSAVTANSGATTGAGIYASGLANVLVSNGGAVSNHTGTTTSGSGVYLFAPGTTLTVDGGTISGNTNAINGGGVYATNGAVVTVQNGGTVTGNDATSSGSGIYATSEAQVTITGVGSAVTANGGATNGAGIYAAGADVFVNNGGAVSNHTGATTSGSGVYLSAPGTTLTVDGGTISGNTNASNGGGVYATTAVVTVQGGGTIIGNDAANDGSGIFATSEAQVTITGVGSAATANGGAVNGAGIYAAGGTDVFVNNGGAVSNHTGATTSGGGVYLSDDGTRLTVDGGTISGNTNATNGGGIYANINAQVTVQGAGMVTGNDATTSGSGIFANGAQVFITGMGSAVTANGGAVNGAGIYAAGGADVYINSGGAVSNHTGATTSGSGVYLSAQGTTLTVESGTISGNTNASNGGGVYATDSAAVTLQNGAVITQNGATGDGGGLYLLSGSTLTITNSTLFGNSAANYGGGLYLLNGGTLTVTNSAFSGNSANYGGGILNGGTLTVTNSAFSGNSATNGGGILNGGTLTVTNSTFSGNSATNGGGIANTSTLTLNNSIVANSVGGDCQIIGGGTINAQYSLMMDGSCGVVNGVNGNQTGSPLLGALQNNGGLTPTMALGTGSPAIDAGSNALIPGGVTTDQRGTDYPRIANATVDMGSYESNPPTHLVFIQQPTDAAVNATISPAITIELRDENDQLVTSATNQVTLSINNNPGGATLGGTTSVNAIDGVATFNDLLIDAAGTGYTLDASTTGLTNVTSDPFTITTESAPTIDTQPQDTTIFSGQSTALSVVASGDSVSYQWYEGTSGDTSMPVGTDSDSFTTPMLTADTSYWVRVSNPAGSTDSDTTTVTVLPAPSITTQPMSTTIFSGQSTALSVVANGSSLSYQWYQGSTGDTSIPVGTNAASYTTPALTTTTSYWVRVSNPAGSVDSDTATISILPAPTITTQPMSTTSFSGFTTLLSVTASGDSVSYQWYEGTSGDTTISVGTDSASFTTPALTTTTSYWVRVSNPAGSTDSDTATVTIESAPVITTQPISQTVNSGEAATLSVTANGSSLSYQWYQGNTGDTSIPVGTNSNILLTSALTATTSYWVRVGNPAGSTDSATATISILTAPVITTQPQSQTISAGTLATLSVVASGGSLSYQWYQGSTGDTSIPVGTNAASFITPALTTTTSYWVFISNSAGNASSDTAVITIASDTPTATIAPSGTPMPTDTPTATEMLTSTPTATETPTNTSTNTPLPTDTPLPSNTPIPTPTATATNTQAQDIQNIINTVQTINARQGIQNSLDAKLQAAQDALSAENGSNPEAAINKLQALINEVQAQRGNQITDSDADLLISLVNQVISRIQGGY